MLSEKCLVLLVFILSKCFCLLGGIKFFRSPNNDILSPGNQNGIIPKEFFAHVELHDRGHSTMLFLQHINIDRDLNGRVV